MNIKKNFLSRIARRKGAAQDESEEGYEIPPPTAIEPGVSYATENSEDKELGSHQELELIASGETASTDSANSVDTLDSGDVPALEALAEPVTDESPDAPEPPRETAPYEEYGLELELLTETESKASPEEPELSLDKSSLEDEAAASAAADSVVQASAPEPEVIQESEPEAADDAVAEVEETLKASVLQDSPDEDEPPLLNEEADSEIAESAAETAAPEPEISKESEPAEDITEEVGEPLEAVVIQDSPDESLEPALADNGIFPLVQDARGVWRPGKGFSRGELREAGLSLADASRLHIRFDKRRRNTHPVNVTSLEQAKSGV